MPAGQGALPAAMHRVEKTKLFKRMNPMEFVLTKLLLHLPNKKVLGQ